MFSYIEVNDGIEIISCNHEWTEPTLNIPDRIDDKIVVGIGENVFENNSYIEELFISDYVRYIGSSAFRNCDKLRKVTLGINLISIGDYAFSQSGNAIREFTFNTYSYSMIYMGTEALGALGEAEIRCPNDEQYQ